MALTAVLTPGYTFAVGEVVTEAKLNDLGNPAIDIEGTISGTSIADGSITSVMFAAGAVDAAAVGADAVTASAIMPGAVNALNTPPDAFFFGAATVTGTGPYAIAFAANGVPTSPVPSNYVAGQTYCFLPNFNCPGACTVNINGIGAQALKKNVGQAVVAGDFLSGELVWIQFDGTNFQLTTTPATAGGPNASVTSFPTTGQPNQVSFAAAQLGGMLQLKSVSVTGVDLTVSGAGGLDTGSVAASTWYYLFCIYNGTTVAGLLSLSATAPTLPAGYFVVSFIGPVLTDASKHVAPYYQAGRKVYLQPSLLITSQAPTSATTYQSLAATTLSTACKTALGLSGTVTADTVFAGYVPPIATVAFGQLGTQNTGALVGIAAAGDANGTGESRVFLTQTGALWTTGSSGNRYFNAVAGSAPFSVPLITPQTFYWSGKTGAADCTIIISGYEF